MIFYFAYQTAAPVPSLWARIKEILSTAIIAGGIGYAIYQLYKVKYSTAGYPKIKLF